MDVVPHARTEFLIDTLLNLLNIPLNLLQAASIRSLTLRDQTGEFTNNPMSSSDIHMSSESGCRYRQELHGVSAQERW